MIKRHVIFKDTFLDNSNKEITEKLLIIIIFNIV